MISVGTANEFCFGKHGDAYCPILLKSGLRESGPRLGRLHGSEKLLRPRLDHLWVRNGYLPACALVFPPPNRNSSLIQPPQHSGRPPNFLGVINKRKLVFGMHADTTHLCWLKRLKRSVDSLPLSLPGESARSAGHSVPHESHGEPPQHSRPVLLCHYLLASVLQTRFWCWTVQDIIQYESQYAVSSGRLPFTRQ